MPSAFNPADHELHSCHIKVWNGLIFVCLSPDETPPPFSEEFREFLPWMEYHQFESSRIAARKTYRVEANWKLVAENFLECYHCAPAHPEFCTRQDMEATHAYGSGLSSGPAEAAKEYEPKLLEWERQAALLGRPKGSVEDDENSLNMKFLMQRPHNETIVSETENGEAVACPMGKRTDYDGGHMHLCFNPLGHIVSCSDYAVLFRFTPQTLGTTEVELIWLVDSSATNVNVERLVWMWDVTTQQDKRIVEGNFLGVNSSKYEPGLYSNEERKVATFINWYLNRLQQSDDHLK
jgi:Rieske 2Fe-2S family protein